MDYTDPNELKGELATALTSFNSYINWQAVGGFGAWATAGYGRGEVSIENARGSDASDLTQWMFAAGASGPLVSSDEVIPGGTTALSLKAETALMQAEIAGSEPVVECQPPPAGAGRIAFAHVVLGGDAGAVDRDRDVLR